jgi:hypothetical protein
MAISRTLLPALVFPGQDYRPVLEVFPEFTRERNIVAARGQPFDEESLQPRVFFALLRREEQRPEYSLTLP